MGRAIGIGKEKSGSPVLAIAGPTASGKSAAALAVAEAFGGTIINADSMQLYRELSVLTARPAAGDMTRMPHRLYGVLPAAERGTVGRWLQMARAEIAATQAAGRLPILVGGTGLYFMALAEGLANVPPVPAEIRARARARHAELGGGAFHAELAALDPTMAARLAPGDTQRVLRAYEVMRATGRSLAAYQQETGGGLHIEAILIMPPRDVLYPAIDERARRMMAGGAVEEVTALLALDLPSEAPAMKAVGVREIARYLDGGLGRDEAVALLQRATRNYAKRQVTWFRHQMRGAHISNAQFSESLLDEMFSFIRKVIDRAESSV
ncbi:MAG: tRNA (adenosine(37)-N6)-dimethylallyltransferase MiaA [Rhodospirillales bacterium]|nr:tRNA (adenosine(37)-N6)-dimethylallyltransferase MiaA [Rhodospirillales bacterium]